jgi:hypothetical protein
MITFQYFDKLKSVSNAEWQHLFAGHPDSAELITFMETHGLEGFQFGSVVASLHGEPVLLAPLWFTNYSIATTLDGAPRSILQKLEQIFPTLRPNVLGVGFVEGEWGSFGLSPVLDYKTKNQAITGALSLIREVAIARKMNVLAYKDFTSSAIGQLSTDAVSGFTCAESMPFSTLNINFDTVDEYISSRPRHLRQDLRRKIRQASNVEVVLTDDPSKHIDHIYRMYEELVSRTDLSFGLQRKSFFLDICKNVPGAKFLLFFLDSKLIGFNLFIDRRDQLVDKYIGMSSPEGRDNNIYFLAWLEKIKYCTEHQIKSIHLGAAAEGIKIRLGASATRCYTYYHHLNPVSNAILNKIKHFVEYKPDMSVALIG